MPIGIRFRARPACFQPVIRIRRVSSGFSGIPKSIGKFVPGRARLPVFLRNVGLFFHSFTVPPESRVLSGQAGFGPATNGYFATAMPIPLVQ
jgi:hypothetical protein